MKRPMADFLRTYDPASWWHRPASRFATAILWGILSLLPLYGAHAQSSNQCEQALIEAETYYVEGRFDDVLSTLSECIDRDDVVVANAVAALRLTSLAYIRKGEVEEARLSVIELLNRQPEYEPDPIRDIPSYVALVDFVKRELQLDAPPPSAEESMLSEEQEERQRSWFQAHKGWLIAGGSAALVGIITAVTVGGGGGGAGGPSPLPGPPALPD